MYERFQLVLVLAVVVALAPGPGRGRVNGSVDILSSLRGIPSLSSFTQLLSTTPIPAELTSHSSLTVLAVPDRFFPSPLFLSQLTSSLPDLLRYHILLDYLTKPDLPPSGRLFPTLYQTSSINLTSSLAVCPTSNATLLSQLAAFPHNLSIISVDAFLVPAGFDLAASEAGRNSAASPAVNITRVLLDAQDFNVAATMLDASGVAAEFEGYEHGVGITLFVPTDRAFASSDSRNYKLRSLPADSKALVLKFHALHSYYPLGSLQSIVNPVQPTVATEDTEAGLYTLNITRVNGSVAIGTGLVQAAITRTVYDQNPVAIFAVSRVLLPKEVFGRDGESAVARAAAPAVALAGAAPGVAAPPAMGPGSDGSRGQISGGKREIVGLFWLVGCLYNCLGIGGLFF